jgi:hypothetical protein
MSGNMWHLRILVWSKRCFSEEMERSHRRIKTVGGIVKKA